MTPPQPWMAGLFLAGLSAGVLSSATEAAVFNLPRQGADPALRARLRELLSTPSRMTDALRALDLFGEAACVVAVGAWLAGAGGGPGALAGAAGAGPWWIESWQLDLGLLLLGAPLLFLLAEVLPRIAGSRLPLPVAQVGLPLLLAFDRLMTPVNLGAGPLIDLAARPFELLWGGQDAPDEEELRGVLGLTARKGDLGQEGVDMVDGILDLDDLRVAQVMTPRTRLVSLPLDATWDEAVEAFASSPHRRLPMRPRHGEEVAGILYAKDLLAAQVQGERPEPRALARRPLFLPGVVRVDDALNRLREVGYQVGVVVDEWGGIQGLLTMEDILEEIVGEIRDEHDEQEAHEEARAVRRRGGSFDLDGALDLEELGELLGVDLDDCPVETLAGLVFHEYGSLPKVGDEVEFRGHRFRVLARERNRIERVLVQQKGEGP